ncbi:peptidylprolyl isomerase [Candidatus Peregrinibacteria bacterium]|nr:MAG: peptidylprolyl isomerase [Candidatus Peregrinibacteria bacterium]
MPAEGEEFVILHTNQGDISLRLFPEHAPQTVANFKKLVNDKFYDSLIFHRIIEGFMIQGGDPEGTGMGGPGYTTPAEIHEALKHIPGALATARLSDNINPLKASSGSQFYIVHQNARFLDGEYTVFGQTFAGMETVNAITQYTGTATVITSAEISIYKK